jgi:hypothetical protein
MRPRLSRTRGSPCFGFLLVITANRVKDTGVSKISFDEVMDAVEGDCVVAVNLFDADLFNVDLFGRVLREANQLNEPVSQAAACSPRRQPVVKQPEKI